MLPTKGDSVRTLITGGTLVTPGDVLPDHTLVIENGAITALAAGLPAARPGDQVIAADDCWVAPGFIDVHVHGADGHDTMDAAPEALHGMARFFAAHGVTAYFPTTMTAPAAAIAAAIANVQACPQPGDGAAHLGAHLEGPYLSTAHKGAQAADHMRDPDPAEYVAWLESGTVRLMTVAPELDGAPELIARGVSLGVEFAAGHTGASYERCQAAADIGLRQATHTFNGMARLHHRQPGPVGATLADDRIYAQVIADGIHLHPAVVRLIVRAKGTAHTILITDAMRATGLPDGVYDLGGQTITVEGGVARLDADTLAGSTLTMDAALRNAMAFAGLTLPQALPMATTTPAEAMGLAGRKGVLAPGADADVVLLDAAGYVRLTMVGGAVVYRA